MPKLPSWGKNLVARIAKGGRAARLTQRPSVKTMRELRRSEVRTLEGQGVDTRRYERILSRAYNKVDDVGERLQSTAGLVQALGENAVKHHL